MKAYTFEVKLSKQEDGLWRAEVPALPGCFVEANTIELAVQGIRDCAAMAIDLYEELGDPLPKKLGVGLELPFKFSLPLVMDEHPMKRFKPRKRRSKELDVSGA